MAGLTVRDQPGTASSPSCMLLPRLTTGAVAEPGHRLRFLERPLFTGVPIPPLEVEIAA
jgi:hypothetical protein